MTFFDAYAISAGLALHIRRAAWAAGKWFIVWRGQIECWNADQRGVAKCTDYTADDLLATDWTTVPAPLAACPVTPSEPSGGGPPSPGFPSFPIGGPPPSFPAPPGGGGGGGSPSGSGPSLPTPDAGTGISVTFDGLSTVDGTGGIYKNIDLNGEHSLDSDGSGSWSATVPNGIVVASGDPISWLINVTKGTGGLYSVSMECSGPVSDPSLGGFLSFPAKPLGSPAPNDYDSLTVIIGGGHATVN